MSNRVVITKENIRGRDFLVTALFEDNRMLEVNCDAIEKKPVLGNIYVGKILRIVSKINAAFVELWPGQMSYLPLDEVKTPLMVRQKREGKLTENDEIIVQVVREAVKTKEPTVSTKLTFQGNAVVLTTENRKLGISKKINGEVRKRFQTLFADKKPNDIGVIVRTNAGNYSDEQILAEFYAIYEEVQKLLEFYRHRTCYSLVYRAPSAYILSIRSYLAMNLEKILTDEPEVYEELCRAFAGEMTDSRGQIQFYEDDSLPLSSLYGIAFKVEEALRERVWLKSGAYLVIQPTETLTVIDVNSGKNVKGNRKDFFLKINLEAAEEIARQLRLRNISGICIVDFINMDSAEEEDELVRALKKYLSGDTVPCVFVDFTRLGLAELTRKKVKKPLWEQVGADLTQKKA